MNTFLSSDQQAQFEQYRTFARQNVAPEAAALVKHESCLKEFLQKVGQKGYLGINVPSEYGGHGGKLLDATLFMEAVGEQEPGLGLTIGNHIAVIEVVKKYGTEQQKSRYLPLLARGEGFATLAFSELNAGTDFEAVSATVTDKLLLSGDKTWVVTGDFATLFLVLAKKAESGELALYLVDRASDATFNLKNEHSLIGLKSAYINDIEFIGTQLSSEAAIVGSQPASEVALYAMAVSKVVLSAAAVGLVESGTELALAHARERKQFGTSIGQFQGIQWKLADMSVDSTAARLLTYRAAWSHDESPADFARNAAMCKWYAGRGARVETGEAVQILGASGLDEGNPLSRFYGDGKVMEIAQGTAEFQKMLLVKELNI